MTTISSRSAVRADCAPGRCLRVTAIVLTTAMVIAGCTSNDTQETSTTGQADTTTTDVVQSTDNSPTSSMGTSTTNPGGGGNESESIEMVQTSFVPTELVVPVGTTVTWTNNDTIAHTTTADDGAWDSATMSPEDTFVFTFDRAGTYEFFCSIHPSTMRGTIQVEG